jgi:nucleotide-binding universal stress UspA family protein
MMRRILYATDSSSASAPAFTRAGALARRNQAKLTLRYVADPLEPIHDGSVFAATYRELRRSAREYGRKGPDRLVAKAGDRHAASKTCPRRHAAGGGNATGQLSTRRTKEEQEP